MTAPAAPPPDVVHFIDSGGQLRALSPDQASEAIGMGWAPASPERVHAEEMEARYGGLGHELAAGLAGFGRALTFGGTDVALTGLNLAKPETLRGLSETNPWVTGLGTVAGVALPLVLSGGTDAPVAGAQLGAVGARAALEAAPALARAAEAAPLLARAAEAVPAALRTGAEWTGPGLAAKLGKAVTGGVEGFGLGEGRGQLGQMVARAVETGAGSAIEGTAYGLGNVVTEDALGDPNLTWQSAAAHVGMSALLGGGLGAALGAGEVAIPAVMKRAATAIEDTATKLKEAYPDLAAKMKWAESAEQVRDLDVAYGKAIKSPKDVMKLQRELGDSVENVANQVNDAQRELFSKARPAETEDLIRATSPWELKPLTASKNVIDSIGTVVNTIRSDPAHFEQGFASKLGLIADGVERASASGDPVQIFEALRLARKEIGSSDFVRFGRSLDMLPFKERETIQLMRTLRGSVRDALTDETAWGPAAARQAGLDGKYSDYQAAADVLSKRGLGPLRGQILNKVVEKGETYYQINPRALKTFLNQMADPRGEMVHEALTDYLSSAKEYVDEMQQTFRHAPSASYDRGALTDLIDKTTEVVGRAKEQAGATQVLNETAASLGFGTPYGMSGVARSLVPQTPSGFGEGMGMILAGHALRALPGGSALVTAMGAAKAVAGAYQRVKNVPEMVATLSNLQRTAQKVAASIDASASTLVRGGVRAGSIGRAEAAAGISREFAKTPDEMQRSFNKRVAEIQRLSDPRALQEALVTATAGIQDAAPKTAQAGAIHTAKAAAFLNAKIPVVQPRGPLAPKPMVSEARIAKFNRYYDAVANPLGVMKQAAAGTLTSEGVEALAAVYPELYDKIRTSVMEQLTKHKNIPYQNLMQISRLLGEDMDGSLKLLPDVQATLNGPSQKQADALAMGPGPQIAPSARGMENVTLSERSKTPLQSSADRRQSQA